MDKEAVAHIHNGIFSSVQFSSVSDIKKNTFESVLMRWMNLEPIT